MRAAEEPNPERALVPEYRPTKAVSINVINGSTAKASRAGRARDKICAGMFIICSVSIVLVSVSVIVVDSDFLRDDDDEGKDDDDDDDGNDDGNDDGRGEDEEP